MLEADKALIAQGTDWLREKYGAEYLYRAVRCYEIKLKEDAAESVQTTLKECNQKLNRYEDFEYSISNHSAWVKKEDKYGFVDINGNEIVPCIYDNVCFSVPHENLWAVCKDNKWGYINKEVEEVIPFRFKQATNFNGCRAKVVTFDDECFNIDFAGNRIEE